MSYVIANTDFISEAAGSLTRLGELINQANLAVAAQTTSIAAAAADEVSVAVATLFGTHGQSYQALCTQTNMFHEEFVRSLASGAQLYENAEASYAIGLSQLIAYGAQNVYNDAGIYAVGLLQLIAEGAQDVYENNGPFGSLITLLKVLYRRATLQF